MSNYRRILIPAGFYFFTVVTHNRQKILCEPEVFKRLNQGFKLANEKMPFTLKAMVVLPDHLHCIWKLPAGDTNFSARWNYIKRFVSIGLNSTINNRREKQVWQRRFWEHCLQNEFDYKNHLDYIHYNPVKHRLVSKPIDWFYSSFHRYVQRGYYESNWGSDEEPGFIKNLFFE